MYAVSVQYKFIHIFKQTMKCFYNTREHHYWTDPYLMTKIITILIIWFLPGSHLLVRPIQIVNTEWEYPYSVARTRSIFAGAWHQATTAVI